MGHIFVAFDSYALWLITHKPLWDLEIGWYIQTNYYWEEQWGWLLASLNFWLAACRGDFVRLVLVYCANCLTALYGISFYRITVKTLCSPFYGQVGSVSIREIVTIYTMNNNACIRDSRSRQRAAGSWLLQLRRKLQGSSDVLSIMRPMNLTVCVARYKILYKCANLCVSSEEGNKAGSRENDVRLKKKSKSVERCIESRSE